MRVAIQGTHGSFSEAAARRRWPDMEPLPCREAKDVVAAVRAGQADAGCLPIENSLIGSVTTTYDLDAEILRLRLRVARDLGGSAFVELDAPVGGSYAGFLDGFLDWYHSLLGIRLEERDRRPRNAFLFQVQPPDGILRIRRPSSLFLGDVRMAAGLRHGRHLQTVLSVTLPTSTAPAGYGRGVVAGGVVTTGRFSLAAPLLYEGSIGLGAAPTHGDLSKYQRTAFVSASSGLRWRFWGRQSLYANLFYHSPYYHDTRIPALDQRDLALDFGWILATRKGREWRIGLTEDPEPSGPGIDLIFRLGVTN